MNARSIQAVDDGKLQAPHVAAGAIPVASLAPQHLARDVHEPVRRPEQVGARIHQPIDGRRRQRRMVVDRRGAERDAGLERGTPLVDIPQIARLRPHRLERARVGDHRVQVLAAHALDVAARALADGELPEHLVGLADRQHERGVQAPAGGAHVGRRPGRVEPQLSHEAGDLQVTAAALVPHEAGDVGHGRTCRTGHVARRAELGRRVLGGDGHRPVWRELLREADHRLPQEHLAIGTFEVHRQSPGADVLERRPRLASEQGAELAVAVTQAERVAVTIEVALDERAEVPEARAARAQVEIQPRLARVDGRPPALRGVADHDAVGLELVGIADRAEVLDGVDLDVATDSEREIRAGYLDGLRKQALFHDLGPVRGRRAGVARGRRWLRRLRHDGRTGQEQHDKGKTPSGSGHRLARKCRSRAMPSGVTSTAETARYAQSSFGAAEMSSWPWCR